MIPARYLYIFSGLIFALSLLALQKYPGQGYVYILFTVLANTLLYFGFRRNAIFFDTFIGIFFWLGFWLKLSIRVAFMGGQFHEAVGNFNGSGAAFDYALLVTSCGFMGLVAVSFLRGKYVFTYPERANAIRQEGLFAFYRDHRIVILTGFSVLFSTVAITNLYFGIYQRGEIPRTVLPYGLSGIFSWLLLFGMASFSAVILNFEFNLNKKTTYPVAILCLLEGFITSVSLLSRGMILNTSALVYGVFKSLKLNAIKSSYRFLVITFLLFVLLFGSSVILVDQFRLKLTEEDSTLNMRAVSHGTKILILDRFVGIEGVMAVSSYPEQGWALLSEALKETYAKQLSFYDRNLITSPYIHTDMTKHHHISLPGIMAFCFYPGSFPFLFGCMFILGAIAAIIEFAVYKLGGGNIILCSLLAQVVAYRYAHFGYLPSQSYLLFGALFLNLFIVYFANNILLYLKKH